MKEDLAAKLKELSAADSPAAIKNRLSAGRRHGHLRDFVYGAIDGAVTTMAVLSGVAGAQLSTSVVIILGIENLLAVGFRCQHSRRRAGGNPISDPGPGRVESVKWDQPFVTLGRLELS